MIFWIASYPKSGNTWLRALISSYYYSHTGFFEDNLLKNIDQFPTKKYYSDKQYNKKIAGDTCKFWISAQEKINKDNKLRFFKTHNIFGKINNHDFTNSKNSIGCLYIVRDPRNVITSLQNHYQLNKEQSLKWITNEKNFVYNVERFKEDGYSDFQFISSWNINYQSWKIQKKIPTKIIKYEDLINQTYTVFLDIIKFINKTSKNPQEIDKTKIKNTLRTTSFEILKKNEDKKGFFESVIDRENPNKKVSFFHLGPKNDWSKFLDSNLKLKLDKVFEKNMRELSYL